MRGENDLILFWTAIAVMTLSGVMTLMSGQAAPFTEFFMWSALVGVGIVIGIQVFITWFNQSPDSKNNKFSAVTTHVSTPVPSQASTTHIEPTSTFENPKRVDPPKPKPVPTSLTPEELKKKAIEQITGRSF